MERLILWAHTAAPYRLPQGRRRALLPSPVPLHRGVLYKRLQLPSAVTTVAAETQRECSKPLLISSPALHRRAAGQLYLWVRDVTRLGVCHIYYPGFSRSIAQDAHWPDNVTSETKEPTSNSTPLHLQCRPKYMKGLPCAAARPQWLSSISGPVHSEL